MCILGVTPGFANQGPGVSVSAENLTPEENYVLNHTARQDPQGQESSQIMDASAFNTMIIHEREESLNR